VSFFELNVINRLRSLSVGSEPRKSSRTRNARSRVRVARIRASDRLDSGTCSSVGVEMGNSFPLGAPLKCGAAHSAGARSLEPVTLRANLSDSAPRKRNLLKTKRGRRCAARGVWHVTTPSDVCAQVEQRAPAECELWEGRRRPEAHTKQPATPLAVVYLAAMIISGPGIGR